MMRKHYDSEEPCHELVLFNFTLFLPNTSKYKEIKEFLENVFTILHRVNKLIAKNINYSSDSSQADDSSLSQYINALSSIFGFVREYNDWYRKPRNDHHTTNSTTVTTKTIIVQQQENEEDQFSFGMSYDDDIVTDNNNNNNNNELRVYSQGFQIFLEQLLFEIDIFITGTNIDNIILKDLQKQNFKNSAKKIQHWMTIQQIVLDILKIISDSTFLDLVYIFDKQQVGKKEKIDKLIQNIQTNYIESIMLLFSFQSFYYTRIKDGSINNNNSNNSFFKTNQEMLLELDDQYRPLLVSLDWIWSFFSWLKTSNNSSLSVLLKKVIENGDFQLIDLEQQKPEKTGIQKKSMFYFQLFFVITKINLLDQLPSSPIDRRNLCLFTISIQDLLGDTSKLETLFSNQRKQLNNSNNQKLSVFSNWKYIVGMISQEAIGYIELESLIENDSDGDYKALVFYLCYFLKNWTTCLDQEEFNLINDFIGKVYSWYIIISEKSTTFKFHTSQNELFRCRFESSILGLASQISVDKISDELLFLLMFFFGQHQSTVSLLPSSPNSVGLNSIQQSLEKYCRNPFKFNSNSLNLNGYDNKPKKKLTLSTSLFTGKKIPIPLFKIWLSTIFSLVLSNVYLYSSSDNKDMEEYSLKQLKVSMTNLTGLMDSLVKFNSKNDRSGQMVLECIFKVIDIYTKNNLYKDKKIIKLFINSLAIIFSKFNGFVSNLTSHPTLARWATYLLTELSRLIQENSRYTYISTEIDYNILEDLLPISNNLSNVDDSFKSMFIDDIIQPIYQNIHQWLNNLINTPNDQEKLIIQQISKFNDHFIRNLYALTNYLSIGLNHKKLGDAMVLQQNLQRLLKGNPTLELQFTLEKLLFHPSLNAKISFYCFNQSLYDPLFISNYKMKCIQMFILSLFIPMDCLDYIKSFLNQPVIINDRLFGQFRYQKFDSNLFNPFELIGKHCPIHKELNEQESLYFSLLVGFIESYFKSSNEWEPKFLSILYYCPHFIYRFMNERIKLSKPIDFKLLFKSFSLIPTSNQDDNNNNNSSNQLQQPQTPSKLQLHLKKKVTKVLSHEQEQEQLRQIYKNRPQFNILSNLVYDYLAINHINSSIPKPIVKNLSNGLSDSYNITQYIIHHFLNTKNYGVNQVDASVLCSYIKLVYKYNTPCLMNFFMIVEQLCLVLKSKFNDNNLKCMILSVFKRILYQLSIKYNLTSIDTMDQYKKEKQVFEYLFDFLLKLVIESLKLTFPQNQNQLATQLQQRYNVLINELRYLNLPDTATIGIKRQQTLNNNINNNNHNNTSEKLLRTCADLLVAIYNFGFFGRNQLFAYSNDIIELYNTRNDFNTILHNSENGVFRQSKIGI
ncbi:hypothetical protein CYY_006556 [Polysphondylium violaceum]|uniref:Uncharacterized protein n=1 Tax=Polysphondylium violaceum TaxID=133409 RepID=A0A8J4V315_9MYCE|nr:hypothetical protein CYY_006556 [Polysphondylium violaceum]